MKTKIKAARKALPEFSEPTSRIITYAEKWIEGQDERTREKILRMFRNSNVDRRYSIMSIDEVFQPKSFAGRNDLFMEKSIALGTEALSKALEAAELAPGDIDMIITTSCTGIMIPSVDAYLVNALRMKQDIVRLPVTEMGCAGGTSALMYARQASLAHPDWNIAVLAIESPTSTFQLDDFSLTNAVSAAIFGDGASCVILGPESKTRPVILDYSMYHFFDIPEMMGFALKDSGLHIILDPQVPNVIEEHFGNIIFPFLKRNQLEIDDIQHFIFHPGGKKIIQTVEDLLKPLGKNIDATREVLKNYGNMSSATVLYVLEAYLEKEIKAGEKGLMLSFGPGFTAQTLLLEWK